MSRQLVYMKQAHVDVQRVKETISDEKVWKAYGALCHQVPMLVLTNGLALTAAFIESKAKPGGPHELVRNHLANVLGLPPGTNLRTYLTNLKLTPEQYMLDTFTVLDAWIFYKRFAESILDVRLGQQANLLEESAADG